MAFCHQHVVTLLQMKDVNPWIIFHVNKTRYCTERDYLLQTGTKDPCKLLTKLLRALQLWISNIYIFDRPGVAGAVLQTAS